MNGSSQAFCLLAPYPEIDYLHIHLPTSAHADSHQGHLNTSTGSLRAVPGSCSLLGPQLLEQPGRKEAEKGQEGEEEDEGEEKGEEKEGRRRGENKRQQKQTKLHPVMCGFRKMPKIPLIQVDFKQGQQGKLPA